ncbi:MAG: hypothetical protein DMF59_15970 [Acidobacteria bacterium]|nr:MAG: hypothetical protein DMF59_15970 [Acidobacteriota bacterium]
MRRALLLLLIAPAAHAANWPEHPVLHAVRVSVPPVIDGDLNDPAWQQAPEFTDFTQHDPDDTKPATMRTSIRIVYDDAAVYFGAKMTDPQRPSSLLYRRDTLGNFDFLSINLDPQLDRLSGNAFTVTPAGEQGDTVLYNDIGEDPSWDGVWESATKITPDGWQAEVRIPFSQLRFPDKPVQLWGINITRRTVRINEWDRIVNTPKGQTGFVSHFADLAGIEGIRRGRPLEVVPYTVGRTDLRSGLGKDPLLGAREMRGDAGVDLKYGVTSSLTLTGALNPDFGQVEVDPAVVNLTQFETFYPEKRPFFIEGLNIFKFADSPAPSHFYFWNNPTMFYTRRIGRAPQVGIDADFVDMPSQTRILGAAKITGKLPGGWTVGGIEALTDAERARFVSGGTFGRQQVEPMTNYFVSRVTKEIGKDSRVGFMLTDVARRLPEELSADLRRSALTGGVDGYTRLGDRTWILEGSAYGTDVRGSEAAIAATQQSPARYFQRPDATSFHFDATRTSLSGWGGTAMLSKSEGLWRPNVGVEAYSPGFETNDIGFLQRTDIISPHAVMQYVNQNVTKHFREQDVWMGAWQNRNFDGVTFERGFFAEWFTTTSNYWNTDIALIVTPGAFDDRLTRGGPIVRTPFSWNSDATVASDSRKNFSVRLNGHDEGSRDGSYFRLIVLNLFTRPRPNLQFTVSPVIRRGHTAAQYVTAIDDPSATATFGKRYVFAHLDQHSFEFQTRADWTVTAKLSFQLFLQPFIASGDYHDFRSLVAARTRDYTPTVETTNPDFNLRSLRGSAVVRWEFRPGSALYVAWNENRADVAPVGDFRVRRDLRAIPNAPSHDVFLVKLSYWLPL